MTEPSEFEELIKRHVNATLRELGVDPAILPSDTSAAVLTLAHRFLDHDRAMQDDPIGTVAAVLGFDKED